MQLFLLIIILALLSITFQGHQFGVGNNAEYIAWLWQKQSGGRFLPHDWYLNTSVLHPNIILPLSWLASFLPLDIVFLLAHSLTRLILCLAVYYLAYFMFENRLIATLSIITVILFPRISLGGHYAEAAHFEASFLGFSLATLVIAFMVRALRNEKFYFYAAIVLGILLNLHLFIGLHLLAIFLLQLLFDHKYRRQLFFSLPITLLVAAPTLITTVIGYISQPHIISTRDVAEILAFRHPHHHSPFTWQPLIIGEFLYYTGFWLILYFLLPAQGKLTQRLILLYVTFTSLFHLLFVEILPVGTVAYFQSFRQTVFFTIFSAIYLASFAVALLEYRSLLSYIIAIILIVTFRLPFIFIPLASISLILYLYWIKRYAVRKQIKFALLPATQNKILLVGFIITIMLILGGAKGWLNPLFRYFFGREEHFRRNYLSTEREANDVCRWIKTNTPEQAIFLIPLTMEGFRILSQRACIVDYKSVTFSQPELWEWFDRISRVGQLLLAIDDKSLQPFDEQYSRVALRQLHRIRFSGKTKELLEQGYRRLSEEAVEKISQLYGANYFLTYNAFLSYKFKQLYANKHYILYSIGNDD